MPSARVVVFIDTAKGRSGKGLDEKVEGEFRSTKGKCKKNSRRRAMVEYSP